MGPLASPFSNSAAFGDLFKFGSWQQSNTFLFSAIPGCCVGHSITMSSPASHLELTFPDILYNLPQHTVTPVKQTYTLCYLFICVISPLDPTLLIYSQRNSNYHNYECFAVSKYFS